MTPSLGRIVLYTLTAEDAAAINRRRTTGESIAERIRTRIVSALSMDSTSAWPVGAQAHIGHSVGAGDTFPMVIVAIRLPSDEEDHEGPYISGQVLLNGNDQLWVREKLESTGEPGFWHWPARV